MNYTNPFRRFLFRADLLKRIKARLADCKRRLGKNEVSDLAVLFHNEPPKVIFDVGANVGFFTWQLTRLFPQALVYAFEPDPAARQLLQQTHGANRQVQVIPMAAADRNGQLAFTQRALSCNSSLGQTTEETGPNHQGNMLVQATALDSFCADRSISRIDLLKTDTEGADLRVLEGAKGLLAEQRIDAIMSEVFFVPTYRGQPTLEDLAGFLRSYGFGLFNIYIARETRCRQACYANVIFTSQRLTRKE